MDMRKYSGTVFLKPGDVKAGPLRVVIVAVTEGKFGRPDLEFSDGTKLSVNATNNRTLVTSYGGESDDWINRRSSSASVKSNTTVRCRRPSS